MGSSGGGGGSSGAVSHSAYLETIHWDWLTAGDTVLMNQPVSAVINAAYGNSPWTGVIAYNPDAPIAAYEATMIAFKAMLAGLDEHTDWSAMFALADTTLDAVSGAEITAEVAAFSAIVDSDINTKALPAFRRGMQDINAVVSSAFVVGEALIIASRDRDVAKYGASLASAMHLTRSENKIKAVSQMMEMLAHRIGWEDAYTKYSIEANRIKIVAKKEEADQNAKIDEEDALWDLELYQYGANMLAAVAGGTSGNKFKGPSKAQSALGGALSGAAAGASVSGGNPYVTAGGAVIGLAAGLMSGS